MRRTSFKKLGYWLSALTVALGTMVVVPSGNTYADSDCDLTTSNGSVLVSTINSLDDGSVICLESGSTVELSSAITIDKNVTLNLNGATLVAGNEAFSEGEGSLIVVGEGIVDGYLVADRMDDGFVSVRGGTYDYKITPAAGYAVYGPEDGKYAVGEATRWSGENGIILMRPGDSTNYSPAEYTPVEVGITSIHNELTLFRVKDLSTGLATDNVTLVDGVLSAADASEGEYEIQYVSGGGNYMGASKVYVYSLGEVTDMTTKKGEDYTAGAGIDLYDAFSNTEDNWRAISPVVGFVEFSAEDTSGSVTIDDDMGVFSSSMTGNYTVNYSINDVNDTHGSFNITVTPWESSKTIVHNLKDECEDNCIGAGDKNWHVQVPDRYKDIFSVENNSETEKATITLLTPYFGTAYYNLVNEDETVSVRQTLNLRVYDVENEVAIKKQEYIDLTSLYNFGQVSLLNATVSTSNGMVNGENLGVVSGGVEATVGKNDVGDGLVETVYYTGVSAGEDTITWQMERNKTATTKIYVYTDAADIEDSYVSLDDGGRVENILDKFSKTNDASEVTFVVDDEDAVVDADAVTFTTVGEKTVTFTETLAGSAINSKKAKIYVTGLEPADDIDVFAGMDGKTVTIKPFRGTTSVTPVGGLNVSVSGDEYTFTSDAAGEYDFVVTVAEEASDTTTELHAYTYHVNVHDKMTVVTNDDSIDLNAEADDADASFTVSGEGDITVADVDGLEISAPDESGKYTVTASAEGDYKIEVTQTIGGATYTETVKISVIDTTPADEPSVDEPVDEPTEPEDPSDPSEEPSEPTTDPEEPSEEPGESTDPAEPETPATDGPSEPETPTDEPGTDEPTSEEKAPVILRDAGFTIGSYLENAREAGSPEEYEKVLRDFEACFGSKEAYEKVQAALRDGGTISTEVEVTPLAAEDVDEEAKKAIENELDLTFLGNVSYYDIDVIVKVNDEVVGTMTDLAYETVIAVSAESAADGYAREYIVVRYHDGKAEIIESLYDEENELLVFASDKFSTYAVAYRDTKLSATNFTPNTGANTVENAGSASANITVATAVAVAVIGLAGAAVFAKRR